MHGLKQINFQNEKAVAEAIMAKNPPKEVDPKDRKSTRLNSSHT